MKMVAFRVQHYRSVIDAGWVDVDDITVLIGKNESGKTSLLKALWKFKPFTDVGYDLHREWPRGRRRAMADDQPVVTVRFEFTPEESATLASIDECLEGLTGVEAQRNYSGDYVYQFLPHNPRAQYGTLTVLETIKRHFSNSPHLALEYVKAGYKGVQEALKRKEEGELDALYTVRRGVEVNGLPSPNPPTQPRRIYSTGAQALQSQIDDAVSDILAAQPVRRAVETVHGWLPTFVYMDDYKVFSGAAQLDALLQRQSEGRLTDEDRTLIQIMEMAGLSLADEMRKCDLPDKEQRILDMHDAAQTLTAEIADRWSQKKYEVLFQADGQHFITFVKDCDTNILVSLEERSKGFQWFFSFDMTFMYETHGQFANAILLLDEPGLHLHAAAQQDLLARMRAYAQHNQMIYTTHLPFMVDFNRLDTIRIVEEHGREGTRVHREWTEAGRDARFTLQAALGLAWSQAMVTEDYTLIVEDVADFWLLTGMSSLLQEAGRDGLDERLAITPAGNAAQVAYVGAFLRDQTPYCAVLFHSTNGDASPHVEMARRWLIDKRHVLCLNEVTGIDGHGTLEDLFPPEYYFAQVNAAYRSELNGSPLIINGGAGPIVAQAETLLRTRGLAGISRERVARTILRDLAQRRPMDMHIEIQEQFTRVIAAINDLVRAWKSDAALRAARQ